jgi:LacI family transcriptional regulator
MKQQGKELLHVGFVNSLENKSVRGTYSGLLRFLATSNAPWEVRVFNPYAATTDELLRFMDWSPVGIATGPDAMSMFLLKLAGRRLRRHTTVYMNRESSPCGRRTVALDVRMDINGIAEAAASLLMKRGLVNFAYVDELERPNETMRSKARGDAFARVLARNNFECARFYNNNGEGGNWADELSRLADWLTELPKPCGIMAYADTCARWIYDACHIARLRIPDQIRIVGVDNDTSICENLSPSLTSIEPDFELCGYLAGQLLFDQLGKSPSAKPICMTYGVKSVVERASTQDVKGSGRIVTAACEIIRLHANEGIDVAEVAKRLKVSRRLLELRFRDVLGIGVAEELRRVRLENVCRQLRNTGLSIREISEKSGFASSSHLNTLFRRTYGMTMRDYRNT